MSTSFFPPQKLFSRPNGQKFCFPYVLYRKLDLALRHTRNIFPQKRVYQNASLSNLYFLISWFIPPCDISLPWLYFPEELRHLIGSSRTSCEFQTCGNSWHKKYRKRFSIEDVLYCLDRIIDRNKFKMDFNIEETFEVFMAVAILTVAIFMVISAPPLINIFIITLTKTLHFWYIT